MNGTAEHTYPIPTHTPDGAYAITSAVFVPGGRGMLDGFLVAYETEPAVFAVHWLMLDDDEQRSYLHQGSYGLTYGDAVAEIVRRLNLSL